MKEKLWYNTPAQEWTEALPVGNGRLGAMVHGGTRNERLQLNHDTLWSNRPGDHHLGLSLHGWIPEIRRLLAAGDVAAAEELVRRHGTGRAQACYQPLADVILDFDLPLPVEAYSRELDLESAICRTGFICSGIKHERELFASHPAGVLVMLCRASHHGSISFRLRLNSEHPLQPWPDGLKTTGIGALGHAPAMVLRRPFQEVESSGQQWRYPEIYSEDGSRRPGAAEVMYDILSGGKGIQFGVFCGVRAVGGRIERQPGWLDVRNADEVMLVIGAETSFVTFDREPDRDFLPTLNHQVTAALETPVETLRRDHEKDYRDLYRRFELQLESGTHENAQHPTDRRIAEFAGSGDTALVALYAQYGRYLAIAGSRSGTEPLNLQGLWNALVIPPWASCYTCNINVQMNYWPMEPANLGECHEPLLRMIHELADAGTHTARTMYNARGWVCHHVTTLWRCTEPIDGKALAFWPMGSGWLCQHLWTHFEYSGDLNFLSEALPVLTGASEFYLDWLVEADDGFLVTPFGNSPENEFLYTDTDGRQSAGFLATGCTMDIAIIRELFSNTLAGMRILDLQSGLIEEISTALAKLPSYRISPDGRLQEWRDDVPEREPQHRHLSHLYPLHPGDEITRETPDLMAACRKSMEGRGDEATGWSMGWKTNVWARLGDGNRAMRILHNLFRTATVANNVITYTDGGGSYPNLFCAAPYTIDGNLGATAGILEMLMQSHERIDKAVFETASSSPWPWIYRLRLLPALPDAWPAGAVRGLCARGGFEIDFEWQDKKPVQVRIYSRLGGPAAIEFCGAVRRSNGEIVDTFFCAGALLFNTRPGESFWLKG